MVVVLNCWQSRRVKNSLPDMDWDKLKVFLALMRSKSARGAARELKVSSSTVVRRLSDLERELDTRLFDRVPEGYLATESAHLLMESAVQVENAILEAERQLSGDDKELEGIVRISLFDMIGQGLLTASLAEFSRQYPKIQLEIVSSYDSADLSRREADIAVRSLPVDTIPPEYLVGRKAIPMLSGIYAHRDLVANKSVEELSKVPWISRRLSSDKKDWIESTEFPDNPVAHYIENLILQTEAVEAGMGMCLIPCLAVRGKENIVQVPGSQLRHKFDIWVVSHKDLQFNSRVRVLREFLVTALRGMQSTLEEVSTT